MIFSTHYYVLSLSAKSTVLYEAFRDSLIRVENQGFPVKPTINTSKIERHNTRHTLMRTVDKCFDFYHTRERLGLVVVGDEDLQSAFDSVTTHRTAVVGRVNGDRTGTRARDLGQIVWPVVKEVISGMRERVMHDLDDCSREGCVASGLVAVVAAAGGGVQGTLLVEDDFRVRGSLATGTQPPAISQDVDVRDVNDDAVDAVIEQVLECGGNVVFMPPGTLGDRGRIVLLLRKMRVP
jgi:hypothetical protein